MSDPFDPARRRLSRPRRPGLIIAVLAFAGMGGAFMQTILLPIQAELPGLLGASREDTAWVVTTTLLVSAVCTPISGRLGDMYGKRRVVLVLLALLVVGSVVCALSPTVLPLIVGRALQGPVMGVIPLGISILRDELPPARLGSAVALVSATLGIGGSLGFPLSAVVTENADWHVLFWVAAGIGVLAFVLVVAVVPVSTFRSLGRLDVVGILGLGLGLLGLLLPISRGHEWGWLSPPTLGLLAGGVLILLVWGRYELRASNPLVDLRVFARPPVLLTNLASIGMGFALFASSIVFPQMLELPAETGGFGLSLLAASLILMPAGLGILVMSPVTGRLERAIGAKPLLVAGGVVLAVAYAAAFVLDLEVWHVFAINIVIGVGIGFAFAAMPTLIMTAVPASETGAANGLNTLMRSLGTSSAAAVIGVVLASSTTAGAVGVPSADEYRTAFLFGLVAAVVGTALAWFIPRPKPHPGEHPSLPEDAVT